MEVERNPRHWSVTYFFWTFWENVFFFGRVAACTQIAFVGVT
jgi:hypothetical protein